MKRTVYKFGPTKAYDYEYEITMVIRRENKLDEVCSENLMDAFREQLNPDEELVSFIVEEN